MPNFTTQTPTIIQTDSSAYTLICTIFCILVFLMFLISLKTIKDIVSKDKSPTPPNDPTPTPTQTPKAVSISHGPIPPEIQALRRSNNRVELKNVDDETAAMIMAILAYELETPIKNLKFKKIVGLD